MESLNDQADPVPTFARPVLSDYLAPVRVKTNSGASAWIRQPPPDWTAHITSLVVSGFEPWQCPQPGPDACLTGQDNAAWILGRWLPGHWNHWRLGQGVNVAAKLLALRPAASERIRSGIEVIQLLVESYGVLVEMPDGSIKSYEEACCNGSSMVPDEQMPCYCWAYDPAASFHDYGFDLHHAGAADAFGRRWTFPQLNNGYADIYLCDGHPIIAARRRRWLALVAIPDWNAKASRTGLAAAH